MLQRHLSTHKRAHRGAAWPLGLGLLALFFAAGLGVWSGLRPDDSAAAPRDPSAHDQPAAADRVRIVPLLPFVADQLIALGAPPVLVPELRGRTPDSWRGIPTLALDHSAGPNLEQLLAADPDIVITNGVYAQFVTQIERATGARVIIMEVDSVAGAIDHVRTLGELVDRRDAAASLIAEMSRLPDDHDPHAQPLDVLAVFGTPHAFYAFLPESYLGDLIARAGGKLITTDVNARALFRGMAPLSMETVLERDPDLLLIVFHGSEQAARTMLERDPLWSSLSAMREGRVVFLQDDLYAMRPGSELHRAYDEIRAALARARTSTM